MSYKNRIENLIKAKEIDLKEGSIYGVEIQNIINELESEYGKWNWEALSSRGFDKKGDYCFIYSYPPVRTLKPITQKDFTVKDSLTKFGRRKSLYIHIPYCTGICNYCYFAKVLDNNKAFVQRGDYPDYLKREYELTKNILGYSPEITSIHFGGGTPSLLNEKEIDYIFDFIRDDLCDDIEITMECAPETIVNDSGKLNIFREAGINRLNLGVESLDDEVLRLMGRRHKSDDTLKALDLMLESGYDNINVDVIYNLPGQSLASWIETLMMLEKRGVHSISAYRLRKHPKKHITSMPGDVFPSYDQGIKMQLAHGVFMKNKNFVRSSSHKYAKYKEKLQVQIENKRGIRNNQLIGLGCGAYGYLNDTFYWNTKSLKDYKEMIDSYQLPLWIGERLGQEEKMNKVMVLGMHTNSGVSISEFIEEFGESPLDRYKYLIEGLCKDLLLEIKDDHIVPSEKGRFFCDEISVKFYSEKKKTELKKYAMKYGMFFEEDKYV